MIRANYYSVIEEKLNLLSVRITSRGKLNILDLHLHSESFYHYFLNELYSWNVQNENEFKPNIEAIDLIDRTNFYVIQVSATNSKQKIESSLKKDLIKSYTKYTFKFVSIASDASELRSKTYDNPHRISFSPVHDIIDKNSILTTIKGLGPDDLKRVYNFIKKELGSEIDPIKLETNLATIINILSKEDWNTGDDTPEKVKFEIERKITHNKLKAAKLIIEDYSIHHNRLDKIYSEFDKQGSNKSKTVLSTIRQEYAKLSVNLTDDQLFFTIIEKVQEKILGSANYQDIPFDELELCVNILVVDAFIRCKIFENPENYNYATT
ncbi:ABC-three component system protein [Chryseobacterium oryzae]|uniref:SMEK domain-containing protein n=1 Tax=Chryseobacterium oryzae TaxID=2929799 RepID=A0ABY4BE70_9FLAO|nr:ABC-three component system protein [Chryseobacterium oryzae]UOE37463.1 SMEK domain-containing protein [Chryseobacterium oryzae]